MRQAGTTVDPGPVLIEETRSGRTQALHHGHAVHLAADGAVLASWGLVETESYLRSAPKPLQAIPFAEVLATRGGDPRALALACASHSGEPRHIELAEQMLASAGLDASALHCATHPPMTKHSVRNAGPQTAIQNNCSGKHAGFLTVCVANGWDTATYLDPAHPLQQRFLDLFQQAIGRRPETGTDGCGAPTFWTSIQELAKTYQWLDQHPVGRTCLDAMADHPELVAGQERFCTLLSAATKGDCVGKVGAAGLYVILHRPSGEALAVKAADGIADVAETLAANLAVRAGWVAADDEILARFIDRPVRSCAGKRIGGFQVRL